MRVVVHGVGAIGGTVAAGEEIPRKGGPAITKSDILVINKTDLAPYVGASLDVMERDAARMRAGRPFVFAPVGMGALPRRQPDSANASGTASHASHRALATARSRSRPHPCARSSPA